VSLVRVFWGSLVLFFKLLQLFVLAAHFGVCDYDTEPYFEPDSAGGWPAAILGFPHFWYSLSTLQGDEAVPPVRFLSSSPIFCSVWVAAFVCASLRFLVYLSVDLVIFSSWLFELLFTSHVPVTSLSFTHPTSRFTYSPHIAYAAHDELSLRRAVEFSALIPYHVSYAP